MKNHERKALVELEVPVKNRNECVTLIWHTMKGEARSAIARKQKMVVFEMNSLTCLTKQPVHYRWGRETGIVARRETKEYRDRLFHHLRQSFRALPRDRWHT